MTESNDCAESGATPTLSAGAAMIIAALDDYQAAYPTATGAKARRHVYSLLEACGITMDDVESRRTATNWLWPGWPARSAGGSSPRIGPIWPACVDGGDTR